MLILVNSYDHTIIGDNDDHIIHLLTVLGTEFPRHALFEHDVEFHPLLSKELAVLNGVLDHLSADPSGCGTSVCVKREWCIHVPVI